MGQQLSVKEKSAETSGLVLVDRRSGLTTPIELETYDGPTDPEMALCPSRYLAIVGFGNKT